MLHYVALVKTEVSEERIASMTRETRIGGLSSVLGLLVTTNVVPTTPILVTLLMAALRSSETSVLGRATRHNIPEKNILHSYRREDLRSYVICRHLVTRQGSHSVGSFRKY
jgi:hypothetical protein